MPLQKQVLPINFASGLDTKTDPLQVAPGKFLDLQNAIFDKGGLLKKRNGYGALAPLSDSLSTLLTTYNGNLTAVGQQLRAFVDGSSQWVDRGHLQPVDVSVSSLIRSNTSQSHADSAVSDNGLVCVAYTDNTPSATYKYAVLDQTTGQTVLPPVTFTATGSARVFFLGGRFVIIYPRGASDLYYIAINSHNPNATPLGPVIVSSQHDPSATIAFDGAVVGNALYLAWNRVAASPAITMAVLDSTMTLSGSESWDTYVATHMSVCSSAHNGGILIHVNFYDSSSQNGFGFAVDNNLNEQKAPTAIITAEVVDNITSVADNGVSTILYEVHASATYNHYMKYATLPLSGAVGTPAVFARSVGLASKAFLLGGSPYVLAVHSSAFQPTYFLFTTTAKPIVKLAYSNASGLVTLGLPSVYVSGNKAYVPYLIKDLVLAVDKSQGLADVGGVYAQNGVNLAVFDVGIVANVSAEIGKNLHLPGGFLWAYDGNVPVEQGFFLWPENLSHTSTTTTGSIAQQDYFYQAVYEWSDSNGNIFRSAPSIPHAVTSASLGVAATNKITVTVPTLRLTYKTANPVKIILYRWSASQQVYYQATTIAGPLLNDTTVDTVSFVDTQADATIAGRSIIYTTGGVVENISAPPISTMALFKSRLMAVDAEDRNLIWFSKQVLDATPVEMSDLFSIYIAPTTGAQGSTGPITALAALDDKLIIFKRDALYYIVGTGPDNTGANNDFSEPNFVTGTVGSINQASVVFMPMGLMFQSDKGIWLLGRDLSTNYIGAPVEDFTRNATVQSAVNVPGTNQVRFTLDTGKTLVFDYYFNQWGTFTNVPAVSSTLYEGLHTFLNSRGQVFQETPGQYLDGASPVNMKFTTSWLSLSGMQGYERAYFFTLLATYITPHKLSVEVAYDYAPGYSQRTVISPDNYNAPWGGDPLWGSGDTWGGTPATEQWRVFFSKQKCQSFQLTLSELFDPLLGVPAGAGFTMSGLNIVVGSKKGYPSLKPSRSAG
jgi:hypothetical protein